MSQYTDASGSPRPDRRKKGHLRSVFEEVIRLVEPFYQHAGGLNGQCPSFWVTRTIRDAYPDISNEDAHLLANAAARYYRAPHEPPGDG